MLLDSEILLGLKKVKVSVASVFFVALIGCCIFLMFNIFFCFNIYQFSYLGMLIYETKAHIYLFFDYMI